MRSANVFIRRGPGNATTFLSQYLTQKAVGQFDLGPAAAFSLIYFLIILMYLALGCVLDQIAILFLTVPVVLPVIVSLGFDPIWFGIIVIITAEIGLVTPPVGLNAFVVSAYSKIPIQDVFIGVAPHVVAHLLILSAFPSLITWLPSTLAP